MDMTKADVDAATSLVLLLHSPGGSFSSAVVPEVPALDLKSGADFSLSTGTRSFSTKSSNGQNLTSLLKVLHQNAPVKQPRRRRNSVSSSSSHRRSKKRSKTLDTPVALLPRLRSHSKRRTSVTGAYGRSTKRREGSLDSDTVRSEPGGVYGDLKFRRRYEDREGMMIGIYGPEARKKLIANYLEKRKRRVWTKQIKYNVRKTFADSRLRVKGRFISKVNEAMLREALLFLT